MRYDNEIPEVVHMDGFNQNYENEYNMISLHSPNPITNHAYGEDFSLQ